MLSLLLTPNNHYPQLVLKRIFRWVEQKSSFRSCRCSFLPQHYHSAWWNFQHHRLKIYRVPGYTPHPPQCHVSTQTIYGLFVWELFEPTHHPLSKPALASARYGISKLWSERWWHTLGCDLPGSETVGDAKKSTRKNPLIFFPIS